MAGQSVDIICAGHICVDITPPFEQGGGKDDGVLLKPGALLFVGPPVFSTGGPVSNTGLAIRRLGQRVLLMGKCGEDGFGRILINYVKQEAPGAEKGMRVVANEATSYSVVVSPPGVDRCILHCPSTNDSFDADDINMNLVKWARLFHFGYPSLMRRMYVNRGAELAKIMKSVKGLGVTTSLDMALPDPGSAAGKADWEAILKRTLPNVDVFVPSAEELLYMLNRNRYKELRKASQGGGETLDHLTITDIVELGETCIHMGVAVILIKCGKHGVYVRTAGQERIKRLGNAVPKDVTSWSGRELFQPCYKPRAIKNTTGAGDNAIAGFLGALLNGTTLEMALRYCAAAGYQNLQSLDAVTGVQSWGETTAFIRGNPPLLKPHLDLSAWMHNRSERQFAGPANHV